MSEEVKMPQMGESIAEGTIVRWLKQVGDSVKRDEPLFEISTDKVDAEIPAPASGVLTEIKVKEGETVAINTVVAVIDGAGATPAAKEPAVSHEAPAKAAPAAEEAKPESRQVAKPSPAQPATTEVPASAQAKPEAAVPAAAPAEDREVRSSPLVKKIAREHGIDVSRLEGTGIGGRVTKNDIMSYIANRGDGEKVASAPRDAPRETAPAPPAAAPQKPAPVVQKPAPVEAPSRPAAGEAEHAGPPPYSEGDRVEIVPMSVMRKRIAERMVESRRISAHVTSIMEIDFTETAKLREELKQEFSRDGVKLTFMPFIIKAAIEGIKKWPIINSSMWGDQVVYKKDINVGVAVALDWGLIVPVVRNADEKSLLGLARAINDLGERARSKQLKPDEVQGGTFTITNPGGFGGLIGTPIINQPQVAIMGVGVIKKRPVVINDAIAIRQIGFLALSFDHRVIDGAVADQYLAAVRDVIESANYNS
ncbi:MAG TPA: dihydrolipoamide acetyltransferase family protein [Blastocatellia bacterium]|nr:dihydrolipoamide acetyltransferase family protein [Blastocatellia bacterium]